MLVTVNHNLILSCSVIICNSLNDKTADNSDNNDKTHNE